MKRKKFEFHYDKKTKKGFMVINGQLIGINADKKTYTNSASGSGSGSGCGGYGIHLI